MLIAKDIAAGRDEDRLTPDMVFRDPYFVDFLGLSGQHVEQDGEDAILRELEAFILDDGDRLRLRHPAKTDHRRQRGLLPRPVVLPSPPAESGGD